MNGYFEWKLISTSLFNCLEICYVCNLFCHLNAFESQQQRWRKYFSICACVSARISFAWYFSFIIYCVSSFRTLAHTYIAIIPFHSFYLILIVSFLCCWSKNLFEPPNVHLFVSCEMKTETPPTNTYGLHSNGTHNVEAVTQNVQMEIRWILQKWSVFTRPHHSIMLMTSN